MGAVESGLAAIAEAGTQAGQLELMQHRARLYEFLRYADYNAFDQDLFTYRTPTDSKTGN